MNERKKMTVKSTVLYYGTYVISFLLPLTLHGGALLTHWFSYLYYHTYLNIPSINHLQFRVLTMLESLALLYHIGFEFWLLSQTLAL